MCPLKITFCVTGEDLLLLSYKILYIQKKIIIKNNWEKKTILIFSNDVDITRLEN